MKKLNSSGMTLIEVMIAVTILAALTVLSSQSINQAIKSKVKMQSHIDEVSQTRDAMRIIEKDINLAFHYRDIEKEIKKMIKDGNKKASAPPGGTRVEGGGIAAPPPPPLPEPTEQDERNNNRLDPVTHFLGLSESLIFVTMNNSHLMKDERHADFHVVEYALKPCKTRGSDSQKTNCLWRRVNYVVNKDMKLGGEEITLLENVQEFKLRYIGKGKQDWVTEWKTDTSGDDVTKDSFPNAVEVSMTVAYGGEKKKKISVQMVVPIRFPNNEEKGSSNEKPIL